MEPVAKGPSLIVFQNRPTLFSLNAVQGSEPAKQAPTQKKRLNVGLLPVNSLPISGTFCIYDYSLCNCVP